MYNKSLLATTTLPQRIYTVGAVLKGFESSFSQYLTDGDIVLMASTLEIRRVTGVVDDNTALLDQAFSNDIAPTGNPITDGGQNLIRVQKKNQSQEQFWGDVVKQMERILGGDGKSVLIASSISGVLFDALVVNEATEFSVLLDENGEDALSNQELTGLIQPGTIIRANNGLRISAVALDAGSVLAYAYSR